MLTTHGGFLILALAFIVFVAVVAAVVIVDVQRMRAEQEGKAMGKGMEYGDFPAGGAKPMGPEAPPKGRGGGKTGAGGANKLPKHALHPRGKARGMGKKGGC
jgi:hypothetical protein